MTRIQPLSPDAVQLGQSLAALEPGAIPAASAPEVLERLHRVRFSLEWHGGGPRMPSSLPFGEATDLCWDPPVLSFQRVRRGTKYAYLEQWRIDTGTWRCGFTVLERHEYVPEPPPAELAAEAMAAELAPLIARRQPDPRLHWTKAGRVRVRIRSIFDVRSNRDGGLLRDAAAPPSSSLAPSSRDAGTTGWSGWTG